MDAKKHPDYSDENRERKSEMFMYNFASAMQAMTESIIGKKDNEETGARYPKGGAKYLDMSSPGDNRLFFVNKVIPLRINRWLAGDWPGAITDWFPCKEDC